MCGIVGVYSKDGVLAHLAGLREAQRRGRHRGPDGEGVCLFHTQVPFARLTTSEQIEEAARGCGSLDLALGHLRLSILDLTEAGRQPMSTADEALWITFNGEIFNYVELREELEAMGAVFRSRTDTEVVLQAYAAWGEACLDRFNGMWSFALVDLRRKRLFAARDRYGVKPFHYHYDGRRLAFASEIKQLLAFDFVPRRANERAVYEFLAFSALEYCEESTFAGIRRLLQGHCLSLDLASGALTVRKWYRPQLDEEPIDEGEAAARMRELLADSVRLRLRSDVEVGSCLSGGLDSSSIVCLMNRALEAEGKSHIQRTFSSHFDDEEANELEYMQEVIAATGVNATIVRPTAEQVLEVLDDVVWHQEEPLGATSIFAQWFVYRSVHEAGVKVMLDGQGADEVMGGYVGCAPSFFAELEATGLADLGKRERERHDTMVAAARSTAVATAPRPLPTYLEWTRADFRREHETSCRYLAAQQAKPFGASAPFKNMLYQMTFLNNLQSLLHLADRSSMAFSVESRVPFLDYRLVEFLFRVPSQLKIREGYRKRILRDAMQGILPEKVRMRVSKLGFAAPERRWQQTVLRPLIREAVESDTMARYIDPDTAARLVRMVDENGVTDNTPFRFLGCYLWLRRFEL